MRPDAIILVFWMLNFKPSFSLSSFTLVKRLFNSSSLSAIRVVSSAYLRLLIFLLASHKPYHWLCQTVGSVFPTSITSQRKKGFESLLNVGIYHSTFLDSKTQDEPPKYLVLKASTANRHMSTQCSCIHLPPNPQGLSAGLSLSPNRHLFHWLHQCSFCFLVNLYIYYYFIFKILVAQLHLTLRDPTDCIPPGFSVHENFPGHFLLQGIFSTQGSNPSLLYLLY